MKAERMKWLWPTVAAIWGLAMAAVLVGILFDVIEILALMEAAGAG